MEILILNITSIWIFFLFVKTKNILLQYLLWTDTSFTILLTWITSFWTDSSFIPSLLMEPSICLILLSICSLAWTGKHIKVTIMCLLLVIWSTNYTSLQIEVVEETKMTIVTMFKENLALTNGIEVWHTSVIENWCCTPSPHGIVGCSYQVQLRIIFCWSARG